MIKQNHTTRRNCYFSHLSIGAKNSPFLFSDVIGVSFHLVLVWIPELSALYILTASVVCLVRGSLWVLITFIK